MRQSLISKLSLYGAQQLLDALKQKLTADDDLWDGDDWRTAIGYADDQDENSVYNLGQLVSLLNDYQEDDFFGTEGWEHRYDF